MVGLGEGDGWPALGRCWLAPAGEAEAEEVEVGDLELGGAPAQGPVLEEAGLSHAGQLLLHGAVIDVRSLLQKRL